MKQHKRLSIEQMQSFPGFENFTDEELEREINTLETLSILFYQLYMKEQNENVKPLKQKEDHETEQRLAA